MTFPAPTGWGAMVPTMTDEQRARIVQEVIRSFEGASLADLRGSRDKLMARAIQGIAQQVTRMNCQTTPDETQAMAQEVLAHIGGLGFLEPLLRIDAGLSEIAVTPYGGVWLQAKGAPAFERAPINPSRTEVWRAVEVLLAPLGRSCSEASPSVDAKIPRSPELPGGARVKILHPVIAPGEGFPSINIRLFEPKPVLPEQIIRWNVAPAAVINALVELVGQGMRVVVIGGTGSGKTTLLSALCNGIPKSARVVKIEDPEEIWLDHPHVVTLEARPAVIGSSVPAYTLTHGVRDAMRMSPKWLIVGEMRDGHAIKALFDAQMSDHPGLSTYHAEGPHAAVRRMALHLNNDLKLEDSGARDLFSQALDLIVQVGLRQGKRGIQGVWEVEKELTDGKVTFRQLYAPGDPQLAAPTIERRI